MEKRRLPAVERAERIAGEQAGRTAAEQAGCTAAEQVGRTAAEQVVGARVGSLRILGNGCHLGYWKNRIWGMS